MKEITIKISAINDVKEFVNAISKYEFDADVVSGRYSVDAKSIMGLFSLDLSKELLLKIHSTDCDEFLTDIKRFII
ncbi:MAG: HPr family phosphocarrier protein [Eubacterium sp.]|jgi:phosphotransferase system HPr-like phosphotransfer protein|nr:HPr family phosphocarrier protein [Eubacterium sp.]